MKFPAKVVAFMSASLVYLLIKAIHIYGGMGMHVEMRSTHHTEIHILKTNIRGYDLATGLRSHADNTRDNATKFQEYDVILTTLPRAVELGRKNSKHTNRVIYKKDNGSLHHEYHDEVDLRVIVLTYNRHKSLDKTLQHLQRIKTDGHRVALEIWIDRSSSGHVNKRILHVARHFRWRHGPVTVWVHGRHVGLYGQWLYTWRPKEIGTEVSMRELALFIEDDVDVSSYVYRWLLAVHLQYHQRLDVACYSSQDTSILLSRGSDQGKELVKPSNTPIIAYRRPASWAMIPHPRVWRHFQDWFETTSSNESFRPYLSAAPLHTKWYKKQEAKNGTTFWTIWFMYFMYDRGLYCTYPNLPTYSGHQHSSLSYNRMEPGLHFTKVKPSIIKQNKLLTSWKASFTNLPLNIPKYDFDGQTVHPK